MADEVERLFQQLVQVLVDRDPKRLSTPFQISELYQDLVPYRTHRAALRFDTHQDYEMAILRLLAGEQGLAAVTPPEAQQALAAEASEANPDTSAFRAYAGATVTLNAEAVRRVLDPQQAYRPPAPAPPDPPPARPPTATVGTPATPTGHPGASGAVGSAVFEVDQVQPAAPVAGSCPHCARAVPPRRSAQYCPSCGGQLRTDECARCGAALDHGWRHCVVCGHRVAGAGS